MYSDNHGSSLRLKGEARLVETSPLFPESCDLRYWDGRSHTLGQPVHSVGAVMASFPTLRPSCDSWASRRAWPLAVRGHPALAARSPKLAPTLRVREWAQGDHWSVLLGAEVVEPGADLGPSPGPRSAGQLSGGVAGGVRAPPGGD